MGEPEGAEKNGERMHERSQDIRGGLGQGFVDEQMRCCLSGPATLCVSRDHLGYPY